MLKPDFYVVANDKTEVVFPSRCFTSLEWAKSNAGVGESIYGIKLYGPPLLSGGERIWKMSQRDNLGKWTDEPRERISRKDQKFKTCTRLTRKQLSRAIR